MNVAQLNTALAGLSPQISGVRDYTDQQVALTNARTDVLLRSAREYAARGIAASSIAHAFSGNLLLSGSIARVSGGDSVSRVGIGFEF